MSHNNKPTAKYVGAWANAGFQFIKLRKHSKEPADKLWGQHLLNAGEITKWIERGGNYGIVIPPDFVILDADARSQGFAKFKRYREDHDLDFDFDSVPEIRTGGYDNATKKFGRHFLFRKDPEIAVVAEDEIYGLEWRSSREGTQGRYIVGAGSIHPDSGHYYKPLNDVQPSEAPLMPPAMLDKIAKKSKKTDGETVEAGKHSAEELEQMLSGLPVEEFNSDSTWWAVLCASHHAVAGSDEGKEVFLDWCEGDAAYSHAREQNEARWDSLSSGDKDSEITVATLYKLLLDRERGDLIPQESAEDQFRSEPQSDDDDPKDAMQEVRGLQYMRASDVEMRDYDWIWQDRFAVGHLHALFGLPGQGKGMLMCEIASILSRGGEWPDHSSKSQNVQVVILSAEDNADESLAPRLLAAEADLDNVFILQATIKEKKKTPGSKSITTSRVFNIGDDLKRLTGLIKKHPQIKVLFIDPIGAFIGNGKQTDSYKSAEVRAILTPITEWASRRGICVIYISHANKNGTGKALNRMTDSQAFGAAPRFVWIVGPDPVNPDSGQKVFAAAKVNIAKESSALSFRIIDAEVTIGGKNATRGHIHWIGESNATADQIVSPSPQGRPTAVEVAETFLSDMIENGPTKQAIIQAKAEGLHSWRTIMRAKKNLGIVSTKEKGVPNGDWLWDFATSSGEELDDL